MDYKRGECGQPKPDAFLYVTDTGASAIIVIDTKTEQSWRVSHKSMYPAPEAGTFSVDGQQFDLMDGVVGLTLGKTHRFDKSRAKKSSGSADRPNSRSRHFSSRTLDFTFATHYVLLGQAWCKMSGAGGFECDIYENLFVKEGEESNGLE